jgi:pantoate--beta-alanine ligase
MPASDGSETIVRTGAALRARVAAWRAAGERVGLVPTMGALHEGHLHLIRAAHAATERVVVSIFVNPKQFGPHEDFAKYPRGESNDVSMSVGAGASLIFAPSVAEMYPPDFATAIRLNGPAQGLESDHRPGHFEGVATVVAKLLLSCLPDAAWFGDKDFQQLLVVRRMVEDLAVPVRVEAVETVREADGLAMSSRNRYLTPDQRRVAPVLYATLRAVAARARDGGDIAAAREMGRAALRSAGFDPVDYLEVRDARTLAAVTDRARPLRVLAAARLGVTRLIDNVAV